MHPISLVKLITEDLLIICRRFSN